VIPYPCVIPYGTSVPVAVRQVSCELSYIRIQRLEGLGSAIAPPAGPDRSRQPNAFLCNSQPKICTNFRCNGKFFLNFFRLHSGPWTFRILLTILLPWTLCPRHCHATAESLDNDRKTEATKEKKPGKVSFRIKYILM